MIFKFCYLKQVKILLKSMANTIVQNCQRGIIFLTFLIIAFYTVLTTIKLIKKLIDPLDSQGGQQGNKYQQGEKPKAEESADKIDDVNAVVQASTVNEDDPTIIKVVKKMSEFMMEYFCILIVIPLNILTGTSKAFSLVFYLFILIVLTFFNVLKLQKGKCENKCINVFLDNLWIIMLFFQLVNIWGATTTMQPYIVVGTS